MRELASESTRTEARLDLDRLSTWAIGGAVCGLLAAIGPLPSALKALLLVAFIFAAPGSAGLQYCADGVPAIARRALVPVLGLAIVFLVLTASMLLGYWHPRVLLLGLAAATLVVGVANRIRFDDDGGAR